MIGCGYDIESSPSLSLTLTSTSTLKYSLSHHALVDGYAQVSANRKKEFSFEEFE
jgi:hypothetical protein